MPIDNPGAEFDIFDKYRHFVSWDTLDGFNVGGDAGFTVTAYGMSVRLFANGGVDADAYLRNVGSFSPLIAAGKKVSVEFVILYLSANTNQTTWLRLAGGFADPPSETEHHFGFKIIGDDIWASNADGATGYLVDTGVNVSAGLQFTRLRAVLDPGTDCKFYVNGVLEWTATIRLPTDPNILLHCQIRQLSTLNRSINLGRVLIEKEY